MVRWLGLFLAISPAFAHGPEQWIAGLMLRDPASREFCCGPMDCYVIDESGVKEITGGFAVHATVPHAIDGSHTEVKSVDETIPYSRAMPVAPDNRYHVCLGWRGGEPKIRCFIVPPGSS